MKTLTRSFAFVCSLPFFACSARDGATGPTGPTGPAGAAGLPGAAGTVMPVPTSTNLGAVSNALELPGAAFYPESLGAAKDGSLFVGSLGGFGIVRFAPGSPIPTSFVAPGAVKTITGILADDATNVLYACENNLQATPFTGSIRAFDLGTGAPKAAYPFVGGGFCNDLALDPSGNLFATDSFGKIYKLAKGATAVVLWSADTLLAPSTATGFGADGIAFDGAVSLYVNTFTDNRLLKIEVNADGSAGVVSKVTVTPALEAPDGMRIVADGTLVVAEGVGRLTRVKITGATAVATAISNRLDSPTSFIVVGDRYWVTEGQVPHFLGSDPTPPKLPFRVQSLTSFK
jgi:sugar lactone lactonase YvrE